MASIFKDIREMTYGQQMPWKANLWSFDLFDRARQKTKASNVKNPQSPAHHHGPQQLLLN